MIYTYDRNRYEKRIKTFHFAIELCSKRLIEIDRNNHQFN